MEIRLLTENPIFTEYPRNEVDIKMTNQPIKTYFVDNRKVLNSQNSIEEIINDVNKLVSKNSEIETAFIYEVKNKSERKLIKEINFN